MTESRLDTRQATSVEAAARDLEAARANLEELTERIIEGKGTEAELEAAERRVRFCERRLEGAQRHEARQAEEERLQALEGLAQRTRERVEDADVEKARRAAEKALDRYVEACVAHNTSLDEAIVALLSVEDAPEGYGVATGSDGHSPTLAGRTYRRIRPMVSVAAMAHEVLRKHIPYGYIDLERPY